jgi:rhombotail lipoprotein
VLKYKYLPLFVPVLLCGCAHGFDRSALQERLNDGVVQTTDTSVSEMRGLKPQLRFPCRVAVYLKPSNSHDWRWTPEDKVVLEQLTAVLKKEGVVADVFPLPEIIAGKGDVKDLRVAAAQCGADALFVIHGAAQTDSYRNVGSVFNITLVGGYIVPGSQKDSLFLIEGALLDVDNGYIYTGVQAEGVGRIMRPTFVIEDRDAVALAKAKAVVQFGDEALKRMRQLAIANAAGTLARPAAVPAQPLPTPVPTIPTVPGPSAKAAPATGVTQAVATADKPATGLTTALKPTGLVLPNMPVPVLSPPPLIPPPIAPPPLSARPRPVGLTTTLTNAMTGQ